MLSGPGYGSETTDSSKANAMQAAGVTRKLPTLGVAGL